MGSIVEESGEKRVRSRKGGQAKNWRNSWGNATGGPPGIGQGRRKGRKSDPRKTLGRKNRTGEESLRGNRTNKQGKRETRARRYKRGRRPKCQNAQRVGKGRAFAIRWGETGKGGVRSPSGRGGEKKKTHASEGALQNHQIAYKMNP